MKVGRRKAWSLYYKRERELSGITGAIHPYEVLEDDDSEPSRIMIFNHQDEIVVSMECDESVRIVVHSKALALAKELSIMYYMNYGTEGLR